MSAVAAPPARRIDPQLLRQRVAALPALPQAVMDVVVSLRSESGSAEDCAQRIARDPAMTARTLRLANSAFYGVPGRVATIRDAIHMLGRRTLGSLLTTATLSAQFSASSCPGFEFAGFWRHTLGVAIASQLIAAELRCEDDVAFTAGLLHDIGLLALAAHFPAELGAVLAHAQADDISPLAAERATLAVDHVQVGAMIATHWHFPPVVVEAIASHHQPSDPTPRGAGASLAEIVHLADAVTHALDIAGAENEMVTEIDPAVWDRLALSPKQVLHVFERTEAGVTALCQALAL